MRGLFLFVLYIFFLFFNSTCFAALSSNASAIGTIVPTVVVTAKHKPSSQTSTSTSASNTIITHDEITLLGATSVSQVLQELGGIQLQDITGNGSQVALSMRGFGSNASSNTLLLVNGIPVTNPDMAPPDLNVIPIQEIESIEIIAGSESVLYGDQAVGGVINIKTHQPTQQKIALTCAGGSYNQKNCYATWQDHYKKLGYGLNILTNHTDNYRVHNDYDQNFIAGRFDYPYQTGNIALDYQITNERMQYPGALTATEVRENRRQSNNNINFFHDWNGFYHLQDKQYFSNNWHLDTDFARRELHGEGVLLSSFTQSRTVHFLRPQLTGTLGKMLLISGIDFENDQYRLSNIFNITNDTQQKYGLFGVANYPLNSHWSFSAGARLAQLNNQLQSPQITNTLNRALATTLGITDQINASTKIYLRRAESFRFPKADENASTPPGVNGLKTQRGVSYETGVQWNWQELVSKASIYQLNLRDEIAFDPTQTPDDPFGTNVNYNPTTRTGFSLVEKYPLTSRVTIDGQYNFVNARFQSGPNTGDRIPLVSENILHAGVNYKISEFWNFYAEAIYTGNQFADNDNANISGKIGGYTAYNTNLRYHWKSLSAAFRVNNIFNKYYYFYTVFQPGLDEQFFYPAPGRNFLITLKYAFA